MSEQNGRAAGDHVEALRRILDARAAGLWYVRGDRLELAAFAPAPDMPREVARRFRDSVLEVDLDRADLGVVKAVAERSAAVSVAGRLPVETGSGYWLRAFGAQRSVAVPLFDPAGAIRAVLSAALPTLGPPDDEQVVETIRQHGSG
ncbi:hypothetical protein [Tautonia sociabilis]|uniref:GAF domain-containing protein n=1 Tax=Tautonia sociabilis TaxID=2080755 RepID=A0A432MK11_9BACT|nr:hypothetical protein [Tautonia sociabilis]RUL87537.1 hypothetical protein TsocGM_11920 [Tautonia sociabilis]